MYRVNYYAGYMPAAKEYEEIYYSKSSAAKTSNHTVTLRKDVANQ